MTEALRGRKEGCHMTNLGTKEIDVRDGTMKWTDAMQRIFDRGALKGAMIELWRQLQSLSIMIYIRKSRAVTQKFLMENINNATTFEKTIQMAIH